MSIGRIDIVTSGAVSFNPKAIGVDGVQTSELKLIGKIGAKSVFGMERDEEHLPSDLELGRVQCAFQMKHMVCL